MYNIIYIYILHNEERNAVEKSDEFLLFVS